MYFWGIFFIGLICLPDCTNDVYSVLLSKKNYSLRYELSKMFIFASFQATSCRWVWLKRDITRGIDACKYIGLQVKLILYFSV